MLFKVGIFFLELSSISSKLSTFCRERQFFFWQEKLVFQPKSFVRGVDLSAVLHDLQWWMVVFMDLRAAPRVSPRAILYLYGPCISSPGMQSAEYLGELARINRLDFSTGKCYGWSSGSDTRLYLHRGLIIQGKQITISYGAKNLGAQMRYSLKHFAKLRVNRFQEGIRRLHRLHFLPLSRAFRQRIILQGVWTQCLHACESIKICQTAWSKLRTAAAFGMGFRCTRNPFLALAVVTNRILDPQFCAIIQSLQTCRNVGRFFPDHIDVMEMCLRGQSKSQGVVALLDDRLLVGSMSKTSRGPGRATDFIYFCPT